MCIESRLRDARDHLNAIIHYCSQHVTDDITWAHIVDAKLEIKEALFELETAPRNALIEMIPQERANV